MVYGIHIRIFTVLEVSEIEILFGKFKPVSMSIVNEY